MGFSLLSDDMKRLFADVLLCFLSFCANRETITYDFDNGFKYVGKLKNGKLHGHGRITSLMLRVKWVQFAIGLDTQQIGVSHESRLEDEE